MYTYSRVEMQHSVSLYNYQSYPGDPAVLAAQGTSAQVVENGSQKLYFNKHGEGQFHQPTPLQRSKRNKEKQQKGEEPARSLDAPMSKEEQQHRFSHHDHSSPT